MTREDTKNFLRRIKQHYQDFSVDDYKIAEWHNELKDYNVDDINNKFEEHLRNEQYGNNIPKIWFLTKYLTKEKDKGKDSADKILTNCQLCGKEIKLSEYEEHYHKCSSVEYVIRQYKKYRNQELPREDIEALGNNKFEELYNKAIDLAYQNGTADEKKYIECYRKSNEDFLD